MGNTKYTLLPVADPLDGTETLGLAQASVSKRATSDQIRRRRGNAAVTTPGAGFATDTYLVGSSVAVPDGQLQVKAKYHCRFRVSKTAAGTATPIVTVRFGILGTTGDSAKLTFTFAAGSAAADTGTFELWVTFQTVGSGTAAVVEGVCELRKNTITAAGIVATAVANITLEATSSGFDSTVASSIIGVSVNGGTSAAWTITNVQADLDLAA